MPRVAFRNIAEQEVEFEYIEAQYIVHAARQYAIGKPQDTYDAIMKNEVSLLCNGKVIHPDNWYFYKVKKDDEIIITPSLGDDLGGLLQAIVGAIFIIVGYITGQFYLWYAGIALMLGGISSLLFQPDLPRLPTIDAGKKSQTYDWAGMKTIVQIDAPIPIVYGTHKIAGNMISAFTEATGLTNYLYMLIALSEGEIDGIVTKTDHSEVCITSDPNDENYKIPAIQLDDQPIDYYSGIRWWYRTGSNTSGVGDEYYPFSQNAIPKFSSAKVELQDGRDIDTAGIVYTTTKPVDMTVVKLVAPSLYSISAGEIYPITVSLKLQWRINGESSWNDYTFYKWAVLKTTGAGTVGAYLTCTRFIDGIYVYEDQPTRLLIITENTYAPFYSYETGLMEKPYYIMVNIYDSDVNLLETIRVDGLLSRTSEININFGSGDDEPVWVEVDYTYRWYWDMVSYGPDAFRHGPTIETIETFYVEQYVCTLSHDAAVGNSWTLSANQLVDSTTVSLTGKTKNPIWDTYTLDFNALGDGLNVYDIRLVRVDGGASTSFDISNDIRLDSVTEIIQGNYIYPNTALLGLRIKATGQLSGSPPNVNVIIRGKKIQVPALSGSEDFHDCFWNEENDRWEYNGSERTWDNETYEEEYSENSILCVRDILLNKRYGLGKYFSTTDINTSGMITDIKECHKGYLFSTVDLLSWWNRGGTIFSNNITYPTVSNVSIDADNSEIDLTSAIVHGFILKLLAPLEKNKEYLFSITLSSMSSPCKLIVYGNSVFRTNTQLYSEEAVSSGTTEFNITPTVAGIDKLLITLDTLSDSPPVAFTGTVTSVSITPTATYSAHNHTFNGVIDSPQAAPVALAEVCESFRCWPVYYSGMYSFVIDKDETPVHTISSGNTIEFSQSFTPLSDIPYKMIGQFADADRKYEMRSLIARSADSTLNKLNELTIGLKGLSERKRAERELRFKLNRITNNTHSISVKCGIDLLYARAGQIINVQNELPSWGTGGRVLAQSGNLITIDQEYTWDNTTASYLIKYQTSGNIFVTATLTASGTDTNVVQLKALDRAPVTDAVYALGVSSSYVKPFRLFSIERTNINEISFIGVEHNASIYTATTLTLVDDPYTVVRSGLEIPGPPRSIRISQLDAIYGIGWSFYAEPQQEDENIVKDIVIQLSTDSDPIWETIAILPMDKSEVRYTNNYLHVLPPHNIYHFKLFCRTAYKNGQPREVRNVELGSSYYVLPKVTGIYLTDLDPNSSQFSGRDINLAWNPVSVSYIANTIPTFGYMVEVYYTSIQSTNLLRTTFIKNEAYTYSYENNVLDGNGTPNDDLYFVIYAVAQGFSDGAPATFHVTNPAPETVLNLTATSIEDGVIFSWNYTTSTSFKVYEYRTKVDAGDWSEWIETTGTSVTRLLTQDEIIAQGSGTSTIYIDVRVVSVFDKYSDIESASTTCINLNITYIVDPVAGQGHFQSIQRALNNVTSNYTRILLRAGTYDLIDETTATNYSDGLTLPDYSVTILGESKDSVIIKNNPGDNWFNSSNKTKVYRFNDFTIHSQNTATSNWSSVFSITGDDIEDNTAEVAIQNVIASLGQSGSGEAATDTGDIFYWYDNGHTGPQQILDCAIKGSLMAVYCWDFNGVMDFHRNTCDDMMFGITMTASALNISSNTFTNVASYPFNLFAVNTGGYVYNNRITGNQHISMYINECNNLMVTNNTIISNNNPAQQINGIYVSEGNNLTISNNKITLNNTTVHTVNGIYLYETDYSTLAGNTITIDVSATNQSHIGIHLTGGGAYGSSRNIISGNNIDLTNNDSADIGMLFNAQSNFNQGSDNITANAGVSITDLGTSNTVTAKDI